MRLTSSKSGEAVDSSIVSYPDRGPWGDAKWRGNASGHLYRDLFLQLKPKVFVDCMAGSGTSIEVARELGIEAFGLDIHTGFNTVRDSIRETVGKEACICLSHPPYGDMILYSDHPDDLSRCESEEAFHSAMQVAMLNQRDATVPGGFYGTLIGDKRRNGQYTSYQAEIIARMPRDELAAVIIKAQHNCVSDRRRYAPMRLPKIMHEYLLLFQKKHGRSMLVLLSDLARQQQERLTGTWTSIVKSVLIALGGSAPLAVIYERVAQAAPQKLAANAHWKDKVRQVLNSHPRLFVSAQRGEWSCA